MAGLFGQPLASGTATSPTDFTPFMRALDRMQQQQQFQQEMGLAKQKFGEDTRRFDTSRQDMLTGREQEFGLAREREQTRQRERGEDIERATDWRGQDLEREEEREQAKREDRQVDIGFRQRAEERAQVEMEAREQEAARREETHAEAKAAREAEDIAVRLVAEHIPNVADFTDETVQEEIEDAPGMTRPVTQRVQLSPMEWGQRAFQQIAGLVVPGHPQAEKIKAAVARQINEQVKLKMQESLAQHKAQLDEIKFKLDASMKAAAAASRTRAGDIAQRREARMAFESLLEYVQDLELGLGGGEGMPPEQFEQYKKMMQDALRMLALMLGGYRTEPAADADTDAVAEPEATVPAQ